MLLGIPLLPLLAMLQLSEEGLPVRLVQLNDPFQFFHEEQLQHALVRVQVRELEELPLQDVVVPGGRREMIIHVPLRANAQRWVFCEELTSQAGWPLSLLAAYSLHQLACSM